MQVKKTFIKKLTIVGLALTVASDITSAIIPFEKSKNDKLIDNGTLTRSSEDGELTCTTLDIGESVPNCTATDTDGPNSTTTHLPATTSADITVGGGNTSVE